MPLEELVLPAKVQLEDKTSTEYYGKFTAEPYESGYGHTVGNSLRRILLSSLEGAAVTAVRIDGAVHEYSTLSGVREDVINIVLNLKKLRVRIHNGVRESIYLSASKSGAVTASQIKGNDNVEVINKDLVIAHLEPGGRLEAEIEVSRGRGYMASDEIAKANRPAGFMPVDALFSPVVKVHYDVEPARVGQKTDYDRLVLEVSTDGSIQPKEALLRAADLLKKSLHIFTPEGDKVALEAAAQTAAACAPAVSTLEPKVEEMLNQPVDVIELSSRAANCLKAARIATIRELVVRTDEELKAIKNFGAKSLEEIKERLTEMGLGLGMKI
ncbi:MAG: DNA-directed RNA polymerase subunit alpha [Elusimicrobiales bacterium]|nr:DNA-directed RNA polymerase subunit alpha [Elusimicrobiales bacterium]